MFEKGKLQYRSEADLSGLLDCSDPTQMEALKLRPWSFLVTWPADCSSENCSCSFIKVEAFNHYNDLSLQGGRKFPVVVFFEEIYNGWSLRAVNDIPARSLLGLFAGEVSKTEEAHHIVILDINLQGIRRER